MNKREVKLLRECISYNPETGELIWMQHPNPRKNSLVVGKRAFNSFDTFGYSRGMFNNKKYRAHQMAFAIYHGRFSKKQIDHINGNRKDNRIENLREVDNKTNSINRKLDKRNNFGCHGIAQRTTTEGESRYRAFITVDGDKHSLGTFKTLGGAIAARKKAERHFGFHENHGREKPLD